ncbi:MAG TPA: penicillin-binding protein 2 [Patescibacteria group bacterium]
MRKNRIKVGAAFSEAIYTEKHSPLRFSIGFGEHSLDMNMRDIVFPIVILGAIILLIGRLFYLQIIKGSDYRLLSDTNRTRTAVVHAPRGVIFDRNGIPLVYNVPGYREEVNGKTTLIDQKAALELLAKGDKNLEIDSLREYPYKDAFAHVLGYIGQISQRQLQEPLYSDYKVGDVIGKEGLEQEYEPLLKGIDGQQLIEVDATGQKVRTLGETDPIPGQNITTTIDKNLQIAVYNAMKSIKKGAAVVSKPDGEILAMVSQPSFDPNLFTMGQHYSATESSYPNVASVLLDGQNQPLLDRVIGGTYPPGSTFKPVVAAAGLESKTIDDSFTVDDTGVVKIGPFTFANWYYTQYGRTEGPVDVVKAIKRSNDIFFYKLGEMLGVDKISAMAAKFGVGKELGIDLMGEESGLLPSREWKLKTIGEQWYTGDDFHYGIGQGYLLTTPLQVNAWTQALANGGVLYKPHLLASQKPQILQNQFLSSQTSDLIKQGMIEACQPGGVGWPLFNYAVTVPAGKYQIDGKNFFTVPEASQSADFQNKIGVSIACKTGTAQQGSETDLPHAWITMYAPAYNPQIVVTVLSEASGEGSNVAGPIAKEILDAYFSEPKN